MAHRRQLPPTHIPKSGIPAIGVTHKLSPLNFRDFLPSKNTSNLEDELK